MIILFVKDIDKLKKFYTESFQLVQVEETPGQWLVLQAGSCQLGLHQIPAAYLEAAANESNCESNTKMLFDVDEDIVALRERLLKQNAQLKDIQSFDNYPFLLCDGEDPEGNIFQLRQRKA
jgi:catechol 2,3-dioxygenase-like lactoylglutathione lyase family enzyme